MPWPWIIGVVLAGIAVGSVLTQLGMSFRLGDVAPAWREADAPPPPIAVAPPPAVEPAATPEPTPAPVRTGPPVWEVAPAPDFPVSGLSQNQARVVVNCVVQGDRRLGDCRVLSETPEGYGFGRAAIEGAQRATVSSEDAVGRRVQFTVRFVLPL